MLKKRKGKITLSEIARELVAVKCEREKLEQQEAELRKQFLLHTEKTVEVEVIVDVPDGTFRVKKCTQEVTKLKPIEEIIAQIKKTDYRHVFSTTLGRLRERFGKGIERFVAGYESVDTVKIYKEG